MVSLLSTALLLALSRAEIIARFKAPVVTQADGLVKVYAGCPEDMRREYQMPIASFAAETVKTLYQGLAMRPVRFEKPGIIIHVGDVRTNVADVVARVSTNDGQVVTRIRVRAPGYADLYQLKLEVVKGFCRSVAHREVSEDEAVALYRRADPRLRAVDERQKLEDWLSGCGTTNDEEGLKLMRRVFEPGRASPRDVLIFASRLFLYPPLHDVRLAGAYDCLSFREAVRLARTDRLTRTVALRKADELPILGGGRGKEMSSAASAYRAFLLAFAAGEADERKLLDLLDDADTKLNVALEKARTTASPTRPSR